MPLLDHFHEPVLSESPWPSFHVQWATFLVGQLNRLLPSPRYLAQANIHLGQQVEADVAELEATDGLQHSVNGSNGDLAVKTLAVPPALMTMPATFPDDLEIQVSDRRSGRAIVGVIELVSPGNKDRAESRDDFGQKCAAYLRQGIGLVVIDLVSDRLFNLHNNLVRAMHQKSSLLLHDETNVYANSYRPAHRQDESVIDVWSFLLEIGKPLPVIPFGIRGHSPIMLDLEASYEQTCRNANLK